MTYWGYHLIFTLPPLVALACLVMRRHPPRAGHAVSTLIMLTIVMLFTTPWDNYAAHLGIWGFGENVSLGYPFRHLAETTPFLGHIPFEEYAFFVLQSLLAILIAMLFLPSPRAEGTPIQRS